MDASPVFLLKDRLLVVTCCCIGGRLAGSRIHAFHINLHFLIAADVAGKRLVTALWCANIVVAASVSAVDGDPDVLQQRAILILELGGVGSANCKNGAALNVGVR